MRGFRELYDGLSVRRVSAQRYHYIQVTDMDEACGRDNEGRPRYVVELSEVDLDSLSEATVKSARQSCGWDSAPDSDEATAEMCFQYGARAPLHSVDTNSATRGFRECRQESYTLTKDSAAYAERMERPVNAIGSTAREYMQGDIYSAMDRGVRADKPEAKIMAKMHGASEQAITARIGQPASGVVALKVRLVDIPSNDPIAYSMGFLCGLGGSALDGPRDQLAPAYIEGYKLGVGVRGNDTPMPDWAKAS